jgi:hypothetical protein
MNMKKKPYSINYNTIEDLMKGYYGSVVATSMNIAPETGDTIINTAKSGDFALGMLGTIEAEISHDAVIKVFGDNPEGSKRGFDVNWHRMPAKISTDYTCVEGGYIINDDLIHVYDDIVKSFF